MDKKKITLLFVLLFVLSFFIYKNIIVETSAAGFEEPTIEELTKQIEEKETVLIYYSAQECLACQIFTPILKDKTSALNIPVYQIDAANTKNLTFVSKYNLMVTPTLVLFKEGKITRQEGALEKDELEKLLVEWDV
ncbi:thioredoxin family protein [Enterococcus caccae]|nr:thioredoxin family protein [Enterococcus caccae]